jgi:hypothetical protein
MCSHQYVYAAVPGTYRAVAAVAETDHAWPPKQP